MKNNNGLEKRRFMTQNEINLILNAVSTGTYAVRNITIWFLYVFPSWLRTEGEI